MATTLGGADSRGFHLLELPLFRLRSCDSTSHTTLRRRQPHSMTFRTFIGSTRAKGSWFLGATGRFPAPLKLSYLHRPVIAFPNPLSPDTSHFAKQPTFCKTSKTSQLVDAFYHLPFQSSQNLPHHVQRPGIPAAVAAADGP